MHALSRRRVLNVNDFAKFRGTKGVGVVSKLAQFPNGNCRAEVSLNFNEKWNGASHTPAVICVTDAGGATVVVGAAIVMATRRRDAGSREGRGTNSALVR